MLQFDTSTELRIAPHLHGVRLSRPGKRDAEGTSVGDALGFPCNVYFLNAQSAIQNINECSALSSGFHSIEDALGRTVFDVLTIDNACLITDVDREVMRTRQIKISDDIMVRNDGESMNFLTVKTPVYSDDNNIIGVFGCSVMIPQQPLADSLTLITKIGMLSSLSQETLGNIIFNMKVGDIFFTRRQSEVIHYYIRGRNARQIAEVMGLSRRTVEKYLDNIKQKMNVTSKIELIDKLIHFSDGNE